MGLMHGSGFGATEQSAGQNQTSGFHARTPLFSANPPPGHVAGRELEKGGTRMKAIGSQVSTAMRLCWGDKHVKRTLEIFAARAGDTEQHGEEQKGKQPSGK